LDARAGPFSEKSQLVGSCARAFFGQRVAGGGNLSLAPCAPETH